jgi:hydrogenase expression/formation protein HypD
MKYIDEFRDGELARAMGATIRAEALPGKVYRLMEFCGGHTHAIYRYGLHDLLPENIQLVHGPGCPVCVLPTERLDLAVAVAKMPNVILCTYGDMLRVPGSRGVSLIKAKAEGADVRMVYSVIDALKVAVDNPSKEVVFLAIGFETTTPPTASAIKRAQAKGIKNFSALCNHVLTPQPLRVILSDAGGGPRIDGIIGPAHVSTVIGAEPYEYVAKEFHRPVVIAGFEPLDMMQAILQLIRQLNENRSEVEVQYKRCVLPEGNKAAQDLMSEVFELRDTFAWRGLGEIPESAVKIRPAFAAFDAEVKLQTAKLDVPPVQEGKGCSCGDILRGLKRPIDCKLFGTACTPESPMGACMVSSEGACAAYYSYGRFRDVR